MHSTFRNLLPSTAGGAILVLALLTGHGPSPAEAKSRPPAQRLPAPENLSETTRSELQKRMRQHGNTMSNLVRAVVLLDRFTVSNLAARIADEEVVASIDAETRNRWMQLLPKDFFIQQDALRTASRALAVSATGKDEDSAMADRFAAVARTCVACHSAYLHGR